MPNPIGNVQVDSLTDDTGRVLIGINSILTASQGLMTNSLKQIVSAGSSTTYVVGGSLLLQGSFAVSRFPMIGTPYNADGNRSFVFITTGAAAFAVNLSSAVGKGGTIIILKKIDAGIGAVTITPAGAETIDGAANYILALQYKYVIVISDNANWFVIGAN